MRRRTSDVDLGKNIRLEPGLKPRIGVARRSYQCRTLATPAGDLSQLNSIRNTGLDLRRDPNTLAGLPGAPSKFYGQAERAISTGKLHALLRFHTQPIKHVVFVCPSSPFWVGRSHLEECFTLICIQRLSQPNFATQPCHWHDSWNTRGSSIPVLSY